MTLSLPFACPWSSPGACIPLALLAGLLSLATGQVARAPCARLAQQPTGFGVSGTVEALLEWDPDGAGPAGLRLVVAGRFSGAGNIAANNLALYDPLAATWTAFGAGTNGVVNALAVLASGELVVGGAFTMAGGVNASGVARWTGSAWTALGTGIPVSSGGVLALAVMQTGDVIAGGLFATAGGSPAQNVARWNGTAWSAMAGGLVNLGTVLGSEPAGVRALGVASNGEVVAAGTIGVGPTNEPLAVFRNGAWLALPGLCSGQFPCVVRSVAMLPNNQILAAGSELVLPPFVKLWDGVSWQSQGLPPAEPQAVVVLPNGEWVVSGGVYGFFQPSLIARWSGSSWQTIGSSPFAPWGERARALVPFSAGGADSFVAGGNLTVVNGQGARSLARWIASAWFGDADVFSQWSGDMSVAVAADGQTVVGAANAYGATQLGGVGQWDGATWQPLGQGLPLLGAVDVGILPDGDVVAVGNGVVRRRTGGVWSSVIGGAAPLGPERVLVLPNGNLVVFRPSFGPASFWDGVAWQSLLTNPTCVAMLPSGQLVAGGYNFWTPGGVHRWDGVAWTSLDPTAVINGIVRAIAVLPNGDVIAAGSFTFGNGIARYNGSSWSPMGAGFGPGLVGALAVSPNGELFAGGGFAASGATACANLARWDGQAWLPVSSGTNGDIADLAFHPSGDLLATGRFSLPTPYFARFATPCPAAATALGSGCASSGGANRLVAVSWPLIGGSFRSQATGLPATCFAVMVNGVAPVSLPLATLLPGGQPGCNLLVSPDATDFVAAAAGVATQLFPVPLSQSLIGAVFHHQVVAIEFDALGNFGAITSTNALTLTVGSVQ